MSDSLATPKPSWIHPILTVPAWTHWSENKVQQLQEECLLLIPWDPIQKKTKQNKKKAHFNSSLYRLVSLDKSQSASHNKLPACGSKSVFLIQ
ncbi:mCG147690 [Mus musculus]|nr:mCG147690 [Mus musculus]